MAATFRHAATPVREEFGDALASSSPHFEENVLLRTCHRVEMVGVLLDDTAPPIVDGVTYLAGTEAAERVFLVAGGFDSAVVAEEQVLGQVRSAYEDALEAGDTGPVLNELYRRALRFGRRVRSEVQPTTDRSLADRSARWIAERLGPEQRPASALVLGTGEMGRLLAEHFARAGMTVTVGSRSESRARRIIDHLSTPNRHRVVATPTALGQVADHDVVAIAVRSSSSPLDTPHLERGGRLPLVIDLSTPSAVTSGAAAVLDDRLLDLDRLGALSVSSPLSDVAERRLRDAARNEAHRFMDWWSMRPNAAGVAMLRAHASEIRERHLDRLRRRPDLSPAQMSAVEAATAAMMGELLHTPTERLRREPGAREVVARIFGIGP
jgi:glutamyl-tRNA reductase